MDEMVDRLLDILADKLTERLSAGHKELYTAKELAERYGVSCATIRSKMAAGEFGELVSVGERTRLVPWAGVQAYESTHTGMSTKRTSEKHIIPLTKPFRWCKARFTLTETGKIKVNGSRDGVIRARRKLKLFHREWLAGKRTLQEVAQYMNCQEAYYKNFDDHGRLLRLRRLCYAIFGGRVPCSTKSSKPVMAPSLP